MITEQQKKVMIELGIDFLDSMTLEEARDAIQDAKGLVEEKNVERKKADEVDQNAIFHNLNPEV